MQGSFRRPGFSQPESRDMFLPCLLPPSPFVITKESLLDGTGHCGAIREPSQHTAHAATTCVFCTCRRLCKAVPVPTHGLWISSRKSDHSLRPPGPGGCLFPGAGIGTWGMPQEGNVPLTSSVQFLLVQWLFCLNPLELIY